MLWVRSAHEKTKLGLCCLKQNNYVVHAQDMIYCVKNSRKLQLFQMNDFKGALKEILVTSHESFLSYV